MLIRLWIAASAALGAALSAQAQTTGADLVGQWTAKQAIEERCHIHLGRGAFRIAPGGPARRLHAERAPQLP
ncbi:MAG: hypothetical protein QGG75_18595 [Alphaproteobacteria bacterium]|nr:hypothetical protein [Alphaproteobacteria bacterium]MDP7427731.1 hypothetical protein [Alphaproteobacteria bacterium]